MSTRFITLFIVVAGSLSVIAIQVPPRRLLTPAEGSPIAVAPNPNNVTVADVDNDEKPDMIVASATTRAITILRGDGTGRFSPVAPTPLSVLEPPNEIAAGDVNGDGRIDLALASHDSYNVVLLLGDGRGAFTSAATSPITMKAGRQPHTHGLMLVDINNDRKLDLITANSNDDNDIAIALGDGQARFAPATASPFGVASSPYPFAVGDLNRDGNPDVIATSTGLGGRPENAASPARALTVLLNDGRGGFQRRDVPMRTSRTWFVAVADINGDRRLDLAVTHTEQPLLSALLGNGDGTFVEVAGSPFNIGDCAWYVSLADFTHDGLLDAAVAANTDVRILRGDGKGAFAADRGSTYGIGKGGWRLVAADVNADNLLDLVTSNLESHTATVLLGQPPGRR